MAPSPAEELPESLPPLVKDIWRMALSSQTLIPEEEPLVRFTGKWRVRAEQDFFNGPQTFANGAADAELILNGRYVQFRGYTAFEEFQYLFEVNLFWDRSCRKYRYMMLDSLLGSPTEASGTWNPARRQLDMEGRLEILGRLMEFQIRFRVVSERKLLFEKLLKNESGKYELVQQIQFDRLYQAE